MFKAALLTAADIAGVNLLFRLRNRNRFRILAYHGVDEEQDPIANYDGFQVHPDRFRAQLAYLSRHYHVISLADVIGRLSRDEVLPSNAVVLTFDDGYMNNFIYAAPILKEFQMPATFFVTTGFINGTHVPWWYSLRYMVRQMGVEELTLMGFTFKIHGLNDRFRAIMEIERLLKIKTIHEIKEALHHLRLHMNAGDLQVLYPFMKIADVKALSRMGFDVQPHTVSHVSLAHEDRSRVEEEIDLSIMTIGEWTNRQPSSFAYPYGANNNLGGSDVRAALARKDIQAAVTTIEGLNTHHTNPHKLHRMNVTNHHVRDRFKALLSGFRGAVS